MRAVRARGIPSSLKFKFVLYIGNDTFGKTSRGTSGDYPRETFMVRTYWFISLQCKGKGTSPAKEGEAAAGAARSGLFVFEALHIINLNRWRNLLFAESFRYPFCAQRQYRARLILILILILIPSQEMHPPFLFFIVFSFQLIHRLGFDGFRLRGNLD